ncbi:class I SAM-dependent methyltransferase [Magnetospira sp. QH-2]|uniref:class I SAM-dependent methyltransferase n=1 Tax=Magnetospira sp. (strain QH-2) TaxID=1288970 RepID=UPI0003E80DF3|nr:class I SAM-dependent methyltransferase [Magnetospira sp. QH-2]CCQ73480.1 Protein of unknown function [Magnetospira sp. QH-2]
MAVSPFLARALIDQAKREPFSGRLVALSRYDMWFRTDHLKVLAADAGFDLRVDPDDDPEPLGANQGLRAELFFKALGFSEVVTLELFDPAPGTVVLDLNLADTPEDMIGCADAVFDLGTSEHVYHPIHLLNHVARMLGPGGRAIHHTPANNMLNHGFFQFSPTFYYDHYEANRFEVLEVMINLFSHPNDEVQSLLPIAREASWREPMMTGAKSAYNFVVARKTPESTVGVPALQAVYTRGPGGPPKT